jgi:hypothetical protein
MSVPIRIHLMPSISAAPHLRLFLPLFIKRLSHCSTKWDGYCSPRMTWSLTPFLLARQNQTALLWYFDHPQANT